NGYHAINHFGPGNRCVRVYCDGTEGNAHQNIQGVRMKLIKLADLDVCGGQKWRSDPLNLSYGKLVQTNLHDQILAAQSGECAEASARATPIAHVSVDILDDKGTVLETRDLREEIESHALGDAATFALHGSGLLDLRLEPKCAWSPIPD